MSIVESRLQRPAHSTPILDLHRALDVESIWDASLRIIGEQLPVHSCSLFLGIEGDRPRDARHHVWAEERPEYQPATSLSVARTFLLSHRHVNLYTYSQIVSEDADAARRRRLQELIVGDWNEFAHLAFWNGDEPEAVLSVRRSSKQPAFAAGEVRFLQELHSWIDAGLWRARAYAEQEARLARYERWSDQGCTCRAIARGTAPREQAVRSAPPVASGSGAQSHAEAPRAQRGVLLQKLSPAERRVATLVAEGLSNGEIAARLHRSRRTVEFQLNAVFRKLELTRRTQLVRALS